MGGSKSSKYAKIMEMYNMTESKTDMKSRLNNTHLHTVLMDYLMNVLGRGQGCTGYSSSLFKECFQSKLSKTSN